MDPEPTFFCSLVWFLAGLQVSSMLPLSLLHQHHRPRPSCLVASRHYGPRPIEDDDVKQHWSALCKLLPPKNLKAEISLSGFWSKSLLENRGFIRGFFGGFFPAHVSKEYGPKQIHARIHQKIHRGNQTPKSTSNFREGVLKESLTVILTYFHTSFFPFCPLCWPRLFLPFSQHLSPFSPPRKVLCSVEQRAQCRAWRGAAPGWTTPQSSGRKFLHEICVKKGQYRCADLAIVTNSVLKVSWQCPLHLAWQFSCHSVPLPLNWQTLAKCPPVPANICFQKRSGVGP